MKWSVLCVCVCVCVCVCWGEGGGGGQLLPQIRSDFAKILTTYNILAEKNSVWKFFKKFEFLQKPDGPKVYTFGTTLSPCFPLKMSETKENKNVIGKNSAIRLSKYFKVKPLIPFPFK